MLGPSRGLILYLSCISWGNLRCRQGMRDLSKPSLLLSCYRNGRVTDLYQLNYEVADVIQPVTRTLSYLIVSDHSGKSDIYNNLGLCRHLSTWAVLSFSPRTISSFLSAP
jgi:hypothetical protein